MLLARRCGEGGTLGDWKIHKPRRVLYVDGEMSMDGIRERDNALSAAPADGILYLQHEALFHLTATALSLTEPEAQAALLEKCISDRIEILLLDNLSCLFSGIRENDADAWDRVLPWLLELRRHRITVIFIAHCGRNGLMRGTSRREDAAFWIINLSELKEVTDDRPGAKFVARFVKNRNATDADCPPLEWRFSKTTGDQKANITWKLISGSELFRQCIEDGLSTASEIAQEMGISKGQASKYAARAIKQGWLKKSGRNYILAPPRNRPLPHVQRQYKIILILIVIPILTPIYINMLVGRWLLASVADTRRPNFNGRDTALRCPRRVQRRNRESAISHSTMAKA